MSNFPFNSDHYKYNEEFNGCPLTIIEARNFADKILYWHTTNRTSDFSESGDGFDDGVNDLAYGLMDLLSDPNAIQRLQTVGEKVRERVVQVLKSENIGYWEKLKKVLIPLFTK